MEMDFDVRKALNFIESSTYHNLNIESIKLSRFFSSSIVIAILQSYWFWSGQPMQDAIIRLIPCVRYSRNFDIYVTIDFFFFI